MTMSKQDPESQGELWLRTDAVASSPGHPFYVRLNELLTEEGFDAFVESLCAPFYSEKKGRPSIRPGVYFRMLLIGYFERLESERGIAWRCADSLSLREFLDIALDERTPDHSSLSRIRSRLTLEVHEEVFGEVLGILARHKLIDGKTVGVDATTLEANAALRSIVRRETNETYKSFLESLARESGIESPTQQDLAKVDRKRPKKGSNDDWKHPHDPDAQITKMKDGSTHMGHKSEHSVDMSGDGAVLSVTLHGGTTGDTKSLPDTLETAQRFLNALCDDERTAKTISSKPAKEIVTDKGYHSNDVLLDLEANGHRAYVSEPDRGRRRWSWAVADAICWRRRVRPPYCSSRVDGGHRR